MKAYPSDLIRNVAIVGHQNAGKTSLVETMVFNSGATTRVGRIEDGTTISDFDDDERERQISIATSLVPIEFEEHKINILDTPGFTDFQGEVQQAIRVCDAVIVVVDGVAGPEVGTEMAFRFADEFNQPPLVVINKLDRENANYNRALEALRERFPDHKFVPITLPLGEQSDLRGVLGTVTRRAYLGKGESPSDVPTDYQEAIEAAHLAVVEAAAEADDVYIEKYFSEGTLTIDEIRDGMRKAARNADLLTVPVFAVSATQNVGIFTLLEALKVYVQPAMMRRAGTKVSLNAEEINFLNPPQKDETPLAAYVFKSFNDKFGTLTYFRIFSGSIKSNDLVWNPNTQHEERLGQLLTVRGKEQFTVDVLHAGDIGVVAKLKNTHTGNTLTTKEFNQFLIAPRLSEPVYSVALHPKTQTDSAKLSPLLAQLTQSDPTLRIIHDSRTNETILSGMGSVQIDISIKRLERLGCSVETTIPKVPYQETISKTATASYRHKKQSGGSGQFGEVSLRIEPIDPNEEFVFESEVFGGAVSGPFIQSTEKGVRQVLPSGPIAGFPVVGVKAIIFDGKMHPVDSKDIAFQIAGRNSFKTAFMQAGPKLLEPYVNLQITVPEENMGDVMGDISNRRGKVQGMDTIAGRSIINAQAPLAEVLRYSNELRSITGGRGIFTMEFSHYEPVPSHLANEIVATYKKAEEDDE